MRAWGSTLVAITDHDTLAGARELLRGTAVATVEARAAPRVIVGVEINTSLDDLARDVARRRWPIERAAHPRPRRGPASMPPSRPSSPGSAPGGASAWRRPWSGSTSSGLPVRDRLPEVPGRHRRPGPAARGARARGAGHAESVDDAFRRYLEPGQAGLRAAAAASGPRAAIEAITAAGGIACAGARAVGDPPRTALIDRLQDWGLGALEV